MEPHPTSLRAFIPSATALRQDLLRLGALFQAAYTCKDTIHAPLAAQDLGTDYLRIRTTPAPAPTPGARITRKRTVMTPRSKQESITFDRHCESEAEAEALVAATFPGEFGPPFTFIRQGWHYAFKGCDVFVEEIQHLGPSVEICGANSEQVEAVAGMLPIERRCIAPVPELVRRVLYSCGLITPDTASTTRFEKDRS